MKRIIAGGLAVATGFGVLLEAKAEITLAPVFGHNMVLQQSAPTPVWGTADPGEQVTVRFADESKTTNADSAGRWQVILDPLAASFEPRDLSVESAAVPRSALPTPRLTNVLVGEVWLAAGQSNMEWPLAKEAHAASELPAATNLMLRLLNLPFAGQSFYAKPFGSNELARMTPEQFYAGTWQPCSPSSARDFSAVAYYFGRDVQRELKVPVGIIHLAVGGSPAEAWIRRAALAGDPALRVMTHGNWLTNTALDAWCRERGGQNLNAAMHAGSPVPGDDLGPHHHFKPGFLWDAGPARLLPFAMRGVLWYQGESNALEPHRVAQHEKLFPLLIRDWREQWGPQRLPFLYCQLSSISTNGGYQASCWPEFRDQQRRFLDLIPDTAMTVTSDLGHPTDVHPRNKRDVGHRLALAALAQIYGRDVEFSGPQMRSVRRDGARLVVSFSHAARLRGRDGQPVRGFEIAGADGVFHEAKAAFFPATIPHDVGRVHLSATEVSAPVAVRYGWTPFTDANLVNAANLPASTFRAEAASD